MEVSVNKLYSANLVLFGILIGVLVSSACGNGLTAFADRGPVEVRIVGANSGAIVPVRVEADESDPLPVMVCDGQENAGICATVYTSSSDYNRMGTF